MNPSAIRSGLVWIAALAGAGAAAAGSPYLAPHASLDVEAVAGQVAREEDHVTALELAEWIQAGRVGLRVVDVRPQAEYDEGALPFAEHVPLEGLAQARFARTDVLVLVSRGGAHAAQGWVFLRALGYRHVYFLRGGMEEWEEDILSPAVEPSRPESSPETRAALARRLELSRYFGGLPHVGVPPAPPRRRRGC